MQDSLHLRVDPSSSAETADVPTPTDYLGEGFGEILVAVLLPNANALVSGYAKARVRDCIDFPLAGSAIALKKGKDGLEDIRLALTGVKPCPVLIEGTDALQGKELDEDALKSLASLLPKQIKPMTSTFTPPGYRRKVASNLSRSLAARLYELA